MKKLKKVLAVSLFLLSFSSFSQKTMEDFFTNKTQVVFLGLDFTQAKFIGKDKFPNPEGLKNHAIKGWNRFLATEPKKYSLHEVFDLKEKYYYNSINYFLKRNDSIDIEGRITDNEHLLTETEVRNNVSSYNTFEQEGLAVSFIVESFNDKKEESFIWVAFIELPTNRIIYLEKMRGEPGGMGQMNFWAGSVYDVVSQLEKRSSELKNR